MASFNPTQACNRSASNERVREWVAARVRAVHDRNAARRRLRVANRAVDKCIATHGCDPVHHVALAAALRALYAMGG